MQSIRGAITLEKNEVKYIKEASIKLFSEILIRNNINIEDILSIFISCTKDIDKDYPGKYIRENFNLKNVAIMHFNEMYVEGSMPLCIRILILIDKKNKNI